VRTNVVNGDGTVTTVAVEDGNLVTGTTQDCVPIVERTKALHNIGYAGYSDMKLAASIPFVMVEKYINDNRITYQEFANSPEHKKRLITDPALAHFRVWNGAL